MDNNSVGGARGDDLYVLAPASGARSAPEMVAVPVRAALIAGLRRCLEELELSEAELVAELGAALEVAPIAKLEEWLHRFEWYASRIALAHLGDEL